jgi:hypothetical protein
MEERPDISKSSDDESDSSSSEEEGSNRTDARDEVKEVHMLAQKETKHVLVWKLVVLVMLLATSFLVCAGTYIILTIAEDTDYKDSVSIDPTWLVTLVHLGSHPSSTTSSRTQSRTRRRFTSKTLCWPPEDCLRQLRPRQ